MHLKTKIVLALVKKKKRKRKKAEEYLSLIKFTQLRFLHFPREQLKHKRYDLDKERSIPGREAARTNLQHVEADGALPLGQHPVNHSKPVAVFQFVYSLLVVLN